MISERTVLECLCRTIDATGGIIKETGCPVADEDWLDIGDVYMAACEALGREPKYAETEEDSE